MTRAQLVWLGVVCWWVCGMIMAGRRLPVTGRPTVMFEGPTVPGLILAFGVMAWMFMLCVNSERTDGDQE